MSRFIKSLYGQNQVNNDNNNNLNNNGIMKRSEIILPGHYCTKSTLDAEVKQIIRIIGKSQREGYWITDDKKEIPEYILLDDYVALDTVPQAKPQRKFGKDIFGDFKPVEINVTEEQVETDDYDFQQTNHQQQTTIHRQTNDNSEKLIALTDKQFEELINRQIVKRKEPINNEVNNEVKVTNDVKREYIDKQTLSIISKASIVSLNDSYEKKYGDRPYKQKKLSLNIELPIDFDLNKLQQIIELFELDDKQIARYIAHQIKINYEEIASIVLQAINGIDLQETKLEPQHKIQPKQNTNHEHKHINKQANVEKDNQEVIENGIKDINNLLSNFLER